MNFKTTLVLLLLLVGVVGVYLLRPGGPGLGGLGASSGSDGAMPEALITGRDFRAILIERDGPRVELRRDDTGRWWQVEPVRFPLASEAVEALVNSALSLAPTQRVEPATSAVQRDKGMTTLAEMGLDPPVARVTYVSEDGVQTLDLGRTTVAGTAYVRPAGVSQTTSGDDAPVYIISSALHDTLLKPSPRDWWPRTLPTIEPQRIAKMELQGKGVRLGLYRTAEGWSLSDTGNQRADLDKARAAVSVLEGVEILNYVGDEAGDLTRFGLDKPTHTLVFADADGHTQTLRLGGAADLAGKTLYANWSDRAEPSPVVFTLPATLLDKLPTDADALRDKRVVTAPPGAVRGQRVNRIGRDSVEVTLRSDASGFAFVGPNPGYAPDNALTQDWLRTLPSARATAFSQAPREAQAPLATVDLQLAGDRTETVGIYENRDGTDGTMLVVRGNEPVAAVLPSEVLAPLLAPIITLRDRTLPSTADAGTITSVRLNRDDGTDFRFDRPDPREPWTLAGEGDLWDRARFNDLLAWIENPTVAQWAAVTELPRGPMARLSLGNNQPAYTVNLDQSLGQRTDLPGVFRLSDPVMQLLRAEYRDRLVVDASASPFQSVLLEKAGARRTIERRPDRRFVASPQTEPALDQAAAARLFDTLAGLRGERVVTADQARIKPEAVALKIQLTGERSQPLSLELYAPADNAGQLWLIRAAGSGRYFVLSAAQGEAITALAPQAVAAK